MMYFNRSATSRPGAAIASVILLGAVSRPRGYFRWIRRLGSGKSAGGEVMVSSVGRVFEDNGSITHRLGN